MTNSFPSFAKWHIYEAENLSFSPTSYSKFKFGDGEMAKQFGEELALAFIEAYKEVLLKETEIVLVPSPYNTIPTASFAMATYFKATLNRFLSENGKEALLESKIHRYKTYSTDYGNLSYEERISLISSDTYHLDKEFLENRLCLFIDDIKITGSHEFIICKQLKDKEIHTKPVFLYYAILQNTNIPPNFENYLNYFYVKNIADLVKIINNSNFTLNTRTVKYLLKLSANDFNFFLQAVPTTLIRNIVNQAISNNYHLMEEYKHNLSHLIHLTKYGN